MAHGIVNGLEVIQINIDQGKRHVLIGKQTDQKIHTVGDLYAVRKTGERIEVVHLIEALLVLFHRTVVL